MSFIVFAGALQNPDMLEIAGCLASFQKESLFLHKKQVMSWIQEDHFRWMDRLWPRSLKQTKKKVVCIQTMLKTSTWLWSPTRTPNPGPVIPADSLSPLPLIALWYEHRHALLMRCLHHSSLMTSDKRPFPHRCHPWSFGGPFLVLEDYEISQSRNNSNNNNNSDIVRI